MYEFSKYLIIPFVFILMGCSSSEVGIQQTTDTKWTQDVTAVQSLTEMSTTLTENSTNTPEPPKTTPLSTVLPGELSIQADPKPLLLAGAEINMERAQFIDAEVGLLLSRGDDEIFSLLRTEDGGYTWRDISPPHLIPKGTFGRDLQLHFFDRDHGWVNFERSSIIWRTEDGGITWEPSQLPFESHVGAATWITSTDRNQVWIFQHINVIGLYKGQEYHAISRSGDGGKTWEIIMDPAMDPSLNLGSKTGLDFLDEDYGWLTRNFEVVEDHFGLDITADGGESWELLELPTPESTQEGLKACRYVLSDPQLFSRRSGILKATIMCDYDDNYTNQDFVYRTDDGGETWKIVDMPKGFLRIINDQILYSISDEIYRSEDGGENWTFIKAITWRSTLSFADPNIALGVAYNPVNGDKSLVKTYTGCESFIVITPQVRTSRSVRLE